MLYKPGKYNNMDYSEVRTEKIRRMWQNCKGKRELKGRYIAEPYAKMNLAYFQRVGTEKGRRSQSQKDWVIEKAT